MKTLIVWLLVLGSALFVNADYKLEIIDLGVEPGYNFTRAYHLAGDYVVGTHHGDHTPFPSSAFVFQLSTKTSHSVGRLGTRDTESGRGRAISPMGRLVGMSIRQHRPPPAGFVSADDANAINAIEWGKPQLNIWRRPRTERSALPAAPPHDTRAFVWESGVFDDIGTHFNWTFSVTNGINSKGQVVGTYWRVDNSTSAFVYDSTTRALRDLGAAYPRNDTQGHAISDNGEVVGWGAGMGAVLWDVNGKLVVIPESETSEAINQRGDIAGSALGGHFLSDPAIWTRNAQGQFERQLLGCHYAIRDCLPSDLNNRPKPDVVGIVRARGLPWFYDGSKGQLIELNQIMAKDTPWRSLIAVHSVDDQRRVVGDGQLKTGEYRAFLLSIIETE